MNKTISGFCNISNKEQSINIDYLDISTLKTKAFIKGRYEGCTNCNSKSCPLYENAPKQI